VVFGGLGVGADSGCGVLYKGHAKQLLSDLFGRSVCSWHRLI